MNDSQFARREMSTDTLVIIPGSTVDNSNVNLLTEEMKSALSSGYRSLIIDMCQLEFLSSAGVGMIFSYVSKFRSKGGDIVLCNISDNILYVLSELDVADYLTIAEDEKAATSACGVTSQSG